MWRHYRKFFREISEVIVYEVQSPTISMFFWQFRRTQAIFRNALRKNALKTFSFNIPKLKIPTQARKNSWKIQFSFSLLGLSFFLLLFYVATLKEWYEKMVLLLALLLPLWPFLVASEPHTPLTDLKCWVVTQSSKLCPVCFNIFSLGRVP